MLRLSEGNQPPVFLVPEVEEEGGNRLSNGQGMGKLEFFYRPVAFLKEIIGNPQFQVVNVMKSNVPRKPLEDRPKFIVT